MGKIFCIIGKSGSGKDTVYNALLRDKALNLKQVTLYATRPARQGEIEGVTYHFTDESKLSELERKGKIIELRKYNTVHGVWCYGTVDDGWFKETENFLLISTLEAYEKIKNYFGKEKVVPVYINVEDGKRLQRAIKREAAQSQPQYEEMCRRFLADSKDFSEQKLKESGIKKIFGNNNIDSCVKNVRKFILNEISEDSVI